MTIKELQGFCLPPDGSTFYDIRKPWSADGWLIATDARICVRIKSKAKRPPGSRVPKIDDMGWGFTFWAGSWQPLKPCGRKSRRGGRAYGLTAVPFKMLDGVQRIDAKYYEKLRHLPNVEYYNVRRRKTHPMLIRFDGGEALVMPVEVG